MARWVTIRLDAFPIDYKVPGTGAWLQFSQDGPGDTGERFLPDDQADFIVRRGYGTEGKVQNSTARSRKTRATSRRKSAKTSGNAKASNAGSVDKLDDAHLAAADRSGNRSGVDPAAG